MTEDSESRSDDDLELDADELFPQRAEPPAPADLGLDPEEAEHLFADHVEASGGPSADEADEPDATDEDAAGVEDEADDDDADDDEPAVATDDADDTDEADEDDTDDADDEADEDVDDADEDDDEDEPAVATDDTDTDVEDDDDSDADVEDDDDDDEWDLVDDDEPLAEVVDTPWPADPDGNGVGHHPTFVLARTLAATIVGGGIIVGLLVGLLLPSAAIFVSAQRYTATLPPLRNLAQRSTVYDAAGNQIARLGTINREDVSLDAVPDLIQHAVIAVEDKTFWTNDGVDFNAILRAAIENFKSGKIEQGGSTITQQLVKNRILTAKRDVNRKIKEILFALRLDHKFTKREILEQYLNTVYFGQGSYGVQSAVERFFLTVDPGATLPRPKRLDEVTIGEAALLAGLISNPEGNNPFVNPQGALRRRAFALTRMVEQHAITQAQADQANTEPLPTLKPEAELRPRTSWAEEVQDRLINDDVYKPLGATPAIRRELVLTGGLQIYATLDPKLQQDAATAMNDILPEKPGFTGALVSMDPTNGFVKAMVAGPGFESSQYNIATSYPGRQAGSTWKIITLAAALEAGFSPNDRVSGSSPCSFKEWGRTQNAEGGGGTMTLRSATAHSVNCAFARTELAVGFDKVIDTAHKLGITQQTLKPVLTLTLGAVESTPLEMATATSTIANGGIHHSPVFVSRIVGPDGKVMFDASKIEGDRAVSEGTAACETDMLRGVITGGTGTAARLNGNRPVAGKTGTTDAKTDANFLGFTPQLATFVWHGNALGRVPGAGFGGQIPARIFKQFMDAALADKPALEFPDPTLVCVRPGATISENGRGLPSKSTPRPATPDTTPTPAAPTPTAAPPPPDTTPPPPMP